MKDSENLNVLLAANEGIPNEIIGLLLVVGIIFTAVVVMMRKSPFYVFGRALLFIGRFLRLVIRPLIRILRLLRIVSRTKVRTPTGTPALGPSIGIAFSRTIAKKTETDITLETGFAETIEKLEQVIKFQKEEVLKTYPDVAEKLKSKFSEIDPAELVKEYICNKLDENLLTSGKLEFPKITEETSESYVATVNSTIKLILLSKSLNMLTEREEYELKILKSIDPSEHQIYIDLDTQAVKEFRDTKKSVEIRNGLVFSKLEIQDIIEDAAYEEEDRIVDSDVNTAKASLAADNDMVKAKYFFTYDVPVRSKINPQSLFEDVEASNIIELFRFSDRKNFYVLSEMRKVINSNIMKLSVLLSAVVYVIFILNIFFSSSIPFTRGFILPSLPIEQVKETPANDKKQSGTPAKKEEKKENTGNTNTNTNDANNEQPAAKDVKEPPAKKNEQTPSEKPEQPAKPEKESSVKQESRVVLAGVSAATTDASYFSIQKGLRLSSKCKDEKCKDQVQVVVVNIAGDYGFYLEEKTIDRGIFGILTTLLGMFIMWLFYKKEYTEFQLYNGTRLDNFMQRCLNRISVNYQKSVQNNVLSMQRPDKLDNMIDNSSKWTTLLPWISFRAFYMEFFLRNVMYQILRNSSYYLLFIPIVFFMVILGTAWLFELQTLIDAVFEQNTFYVLFLVLIYYYYKYLRESVTFILDTIKEETWQEFHKLKIHTSMKNYVKAWAQNLKQWRDARKSSDGA